MIHYLIKIPGPQFLLLFSFLSLVCIAAAWFLKNALDGSGKYPMPRPDQLDPVAISALRGGKNEVIRTVIFDLWNQNLIDIDDGTIESIPDQAVQGSFHKAVYRFTMTPRKSSVLFSDSSLTTYFTVHLKPVVDTLINLGLLENPNDIRRKWVLFVSAFIIIFSTGGTKLALGLMRNRPVGILVILLVVSLIGLLFALKPWATAPTRLGRRYLRLLEDHFQILKHSLTKQKATHDFNPALGIAIFGLGAIAGNDLYQPFSDAFARGSGGSDGGGCGGGGGGCGGGGGGCGGCGD